MHEKTRNHVVKDYKNGGWIAMTFGCSKKGVGLSQRLSNQEWKPRIFNGIEDLEG